MYPIEVGFVVLGATTERRFKIFHKKNNDHPTRNESCKQKSIRCALPGGDRWQKLSREKLGENRSCNRDNWRVKII